MKTKVISVHPEFPEFEKITQAVRVIKQGGLVIFPTETVYGLGCDHNNPKAMERLVKVKQRSAGKPFAVLVSSPTELMKVSGCDATGLYKLIYQFWPGPLTVVVPIKDSKDNLLNLGLRMPNHPVALRLVQAADCLIAAPSANIENHPAPVTCQEALNDLDGLVDLALDSGRAQFGVSSTVVDFTVNPVKVLREGLITQTQIEETMKKKTILFVCTGNSCRSVMAEYLLRKLVKDRADIEVLSAGTGVYVRSGASLETIEVLKKEGMDARDHQSQSVTNTLLKKADLILVMTRQHRLQVLDKNPEIEKRVYLLKEFANVGRWEIDDMDIADPIGKSAHAYEECMWTIKEAIAKVAKLI